MNAVILSDIRLRWELVRVASNVDRVLRLVHSHVVDAHCRWENEMVQVDRTEVGGHAQIGNDILRQCAVSSNASYLGAMTITHHGFLWDRTRGNLNASIRGSTRTSHGPCLLAIAEPSDVLSKFRQ